MASELLEFEDEDDQNVVAGGAITPGSLSCGGPQTQADMENSSSKATASGLTGVKRFYEQRADSYQISP